MEALMPTRRASGVLGPMLVALALHAAFMALFVLRHQNDVSCLMCAAVHDVGREGLEEIRQGFGGGYDGPDYYRIAQQPLARHPIAPVRHTRIGFPALSWLASGGGHPYVLLWAMPLINLLAIAGLAAVGARMAQRHDLSPWWGCLLPLAINACIPAMRNLTDIVATFALAALLIAWVERRSPWVLLGCALAAVLSREQNTVFVGVILVVAAWQRQGKAVLAMAVSLLVWAGWVHHVRGLYNCWPFLSTHNHFSPPLGGMVECLRELIDRGFPQKYLVRHSLGLAMVLFQLGLCVWSLRWKLEPGLRLTLLASAAFTAVGGHEIFIDYWSFGRVFAMLPLCLFLACCQARVTWPMPLLASISLLTVYQSKHF